MPQLWIQQNGQWHSRDPAPRFTIGPRPDCSLVILQRELPGIAVTLLEEGDCFVVKCPCATHLILINGEEAKPIDRLRPGDELTVAGCRIVHGNPAAQLDLSLGASQVDPKKVPGPGGQKQRGDARNSVRCRCGQKLQIVANGEFDLQCCPACGEWMPARPENNSAKRVRPRRSSVTNSRASRGEFRSPSALCSICQTMIDPNDEQTACPSCELPYHTECWQENFGCSAYGCSQVNCLKCGPDLRIAPSADKSPPARFPPPLPPSPESDSFLAPEVPWEYLLLAFSLLSCVIGTFLYGLPSVASDGLAIWLLRRRPDLAGTWIIRLVRYLNVSGFLIGVEVSRRLYEFPGK